MICSREAQDLQTSELLLQSSPWLLQTEKSWAVVLVKPKKKKKILPENQCGLRGNRTWHRMKLVWVLFHASRGEGSCSLFSQGTWDIRCASNVPNPRLGSWDFTLLLAPPSPPANTRSWCLWALVLGPPKTNQRWHWKQQTPNLWKMKPQIMSRCLHPICHLQHHIWNAACLNNPWVSLSVFFLNWCFNLYINIVY